MQRNIFLWLENEWILKEINWLWQYDKYDEYDNMASMTNMIITSNNVM